MIKYNNQKALLATKHHKEKAIAPVFMQTMGLEIVTKNFDTDIFGTFTGEVERKLSPFDTCLKKAKVVGSCFNSALALATEGSFGPHPQVPFASIHNEIMVFVDQINNLIIYEQLTTIDTNYKTATIKSLDELQYFLNGSEFPSHAVCLQTKDQKLIAKGIKEKNKLYELVTENIKHTALMISTDMRAMMNPKRMSNIALLATKLTEKLQSFCPKCKIPGFGFAKTSSSLPCETCGFSTKFHQYEIWACVKCTYKETRKRADGKTKAESIFCDNCNP